MNKLLPIGGVLLVLGSILVFAPAPQSVTGCFQSVINAYSGAGPCQPNQTYIDNFLFATSPSSSTGLWSASQLTTQTGFLKAYYFLGSGSSLTSYTMTYSSTTSAAPPVTMTGLTTGKDSGSGLTWIGVTPPAASLPQGQKTDFNLKITDSSGTTATKDGYFTYIGTSAPSYTESFVVNDYTNFASGRGAPPMSGVQIVITGANGQGVGQVVTDASGTASIALAGPITGQTSGQYTAQPTSPSGYYPVNSQTVIAGQQPTTFYFQMFKGPACNYSGQVNCYPACGSPNSQGFAYNPQCRTDCPPAGTQFATATTCSATTNTTFVVTFCSTMTTSGSTTTAGPCLSTTSVTCLYGGFYPTCSTYSTSFSISSFSSVCIQNIVGSTQTIIQNGMTTTVTTTSQSCSSTGGGGGLGISQGTVTFTGYLMLVSGAALVVLGVKRKR